MFILRNKNTTSFVAIVEFLTLHIISMINMAVTGTVSVAHKLGHSLRCSLLPSYGTVTGQGLGAFENLLLNDCQIRRGCLSVRPHGTTRLQLDGFSRRFIFYHFFEKFVDKIQISLKSDRNNGYFTSTLRNVSEERRFYSTVVS